MHGKQQYYSVFLGSILILFLTVNQGSADPYTGWDMYWGDIHCHAKYSADSTYEGSLVSPDQFYENAKTNGLDFAALTEHDSIFGIDLLTAHWEEVKTAALNASGPDFVGIAGFEWTNNGGRLDPSMLPSFYKHRVVLFPHSYTGSLFPSHEPDYATTRMLLEAVQNNTPEAIVDNPHPLACDPDVMCAKGAWDYGLFPQNLKQYMYVTEIGRGFTPFLETPDPFYKFEKFINRALSVRSVYGKPLFKPGFIGVSDVPHDGQPGTNCLTVVYTSELTDLAIFDALRKRRTYATTGIRIRMKFWTISPLMVEYMMGEDMQINPGDFVTFQWEVVTSPNPDDAIQKIDLISNNTILWSNTFSPPIRTHKSNLAIPVLKDRYVYLRVIQTNGHVAWSSPVYMEINTPVPINSTERFPVIFFELAGLTTLFAFSMSKLM